MGTTIIGEDVAEPVKTNRWHKIWQKISFWKKKQNTSAPTATQNGDIIDDNGVPSGVVKHMAPDELLSISLKELLSSYVQNVYTQDEQKKNDYIVSKFQKYYGKDFKVDEAKIKFDDPKVAQVAEDYLNDKLEAIKNKALSMDISNLNEAASEIYKFIGFADINLMKTPKDSADLMFQHRVGDFPQMANTFTVLDVVRDILDISTDSTMLLGAEVRLEKDIKKMEGLHQQEAITSEQMAIIYENIGRIHDHYFAKDKGYNTGSIGQEKKIARKYMEEALNLTGDVDRIQSCVEYLQQDGKKLTPKIARMVRTAYGRYFDKMKDDNEPPSSKAHEKYADAIVEQESYVGFIDEAGRQKIHHQTDQALSHYIMAIKSSPRNENKVQVLNKMLHYLQKYHYGEQDEYFWKSVNVVNDAFSGSNKVMSLMKLLPQIKENLPLKKVLLEASFNELLETNDMDENSRNLLLKNTGRQWMDLADAQKDAKGIAFVNKTLDDIENADKTRLQKEQLPISRVSSGGKDYFA